jgi:hypothetical protein
MDAEWSGIIPLSVAHTIQSLKEVSEHCTLALHGYTRIVPFDRLDLGSLTHAIQTGFTIMSHSPQAVISVQNTIQMLGLLYIGNIDFPAAYRAAISENAPRKRHSPKHEWVGVTDVKRRSLSPPPPVSPSSPQQNEQLYTADDNSETAAAADSKNGGLTEYDSSDSDNDTQPSPLRVADDDDDQDDAAE